MLHYFHLTMILNSPIHPKLHKQQYKSNMAGIDCHLFEQIIHLFGVHFPLHLFYIGKIMLTGMPRDKNHVE